ncbi:hypothetical protein IV38_GL002142 [Lactobacillus selangorensis]|uniref:Integral membrane protein n=2 Tax=Lactobacillus selangorensis TaxID=81857 RepID=A0A0R2FS57_9LACO|nr:hypothetical protein IV38_GL002142 [Lactobacillus selangorensis]KRN31315.1 hypothetical protein IV40_GL001308 [Lactobacillus selangorensis]
MNKLGRTLNWCALFLAILAAAIFLTILISDPLFWLNSKLQHLTVIADLKLHVLMHNYHQLLHYLTAPWPVKFSLANFVSSYAGMHHFADVRHLFLLTEIVLVVTGIASFFFLRKLKRSHELWRLIRPFEWATLVPVILAFLLAMNFDAFFVTFHEILFRNSDWLFNPNTDPIINVLPESFFMQCFIIGFVLFEGFLVWGIVAGRKQLKADK